MLIKKIDTYEKTVYTVDQINTPEVSTTDTNKILESCKETIQQVAKSENTPSLVTMFEELTKDWFRHASENKSFDLESLMKALEFSFPKYDSFRLLDNGRSHFLHIMNNTHLLWFKGEAPEHILIAAILDHIQETDANLNQEIEALFGEAVFIPLNEDHRPYSGERDHRAAHLENAPFLSLAGKYLEITHAIERALKWGYQTKTKEETSEFLIWLEQLGTSLKGTNSTLEKILFQLIDDKRQQFVSK